MAKDKLKKVNVPEMFYQRFLADIPATTSLLQKLNSTAPTARGRGLSRWIPEITLTEWNELYQHAAAGRAQMQGADRETTLRPAICARALAERMEGLGVDNPVTYIPKRKKAVAPAPVIDTNDDLDDDDTDLSSIIPSNPPVVDQVADVDEADDNDLGTMHDDLAIG